MNDRDGCIKLVILMYFLKSGGFIKIFFIYFFWDKNIFFIKENLIGD